MVVVVHVIAAVVAILVAAAAQKKIVGIIKMHPPLQQEEADDNSSSSVVIILNCASNSSFSSPTRVVPLLETFLAHCSGFRGGCFLTFFPRPLFRDLDAITVTKGEKGRRNKSLRGDFLRLFR